MTSNGLCVHCVSGTTMGGEPRGTMEKIGPYPTYITHPSSGAPTDASRAILYAYDAFGLGLNNNKILPDVLADKTGMTVYVPDIFEGDCVPSDAMRMPTTAKETREQGYVAKFLSMLQILPRLPWAYRNYPYAKRLATVGAWADALKTERGVQRLGGVGYCYGGKIVARMDAAGKLSAAVYCHPSFMKKDDFEEAQSPSLFLCAEEDMVFGPALTKTAEEVFERRGEVVKGEFHQYEK